MREIQNCRFNPQVGKISWSRKWQPAPVGLPGKFYGQKRLAGYNSGGHKELDMTEHAPTHITTVNGEREYIVILRGTGCQGRPEERHFTQPWVPSGGE